MMERKLVAEFIGTFWLVLGGCGSAVMAAAFPNVGIGLLGVVPAGKKRLKSGENRLPKNFIMPMKNRRSGFFPDS